MGMKIGELARKSGCQPVTIRYYEKEGLIRSPERSDGNYRLYTREDAERLEFIRHCRKHDMNLAEIKDLLAFRDSGTNDCGWVSEMVERHIVNVDEQISSLNRLKAHLQALRSQCSGGESAGSCGIMHTLSHPELCACCHKRQPGDEAPSASDPEQHGTPRMDPIGTAKPGDIV